MAFRLTEVDGVPALVAANGGPTVAGLVFRSAGPTSDSPGRA